MILKLDYLTTSPHSDALDDDQLDEQFGDFDASNIAIEERAIDEDTVKQIGVHKRKRAAGEGDEPKKKKKRAEKPRRKKNKDGDEEGGDLGDGGRKSKRSKKEGRVRGASPDEEAEANLTPEERTSKDCYTQMVMLTAHRPKACTRAPDGRYCQKQLDPPPQEGRH